MSDSGTRYDFDQADIEYDEALDAVRITWKRSASGDEFKNVLNSGLRLAKYRSATNWIADLREMGPVAPDDQGWMNEEWFPEALSTSLTQMAAVKSEFRVQQISEDKIEQEVGDGLTYHYFDTVADAEDWLDTSS